MPWKGVKSNWENVGSNGIIFRPGMCEPAENGVGVILACGSDKSVLGKENVLGKL